MKKKHHPSTPPKPHVTYIQLPEYLKCFMYHKHGNPMSFGGLTHYSVLLVNHLACNKYMRYIYTKYSVSEYAYGIATGTKPAQLDMFKRGYVPTKEELPDFAAIYIPEDVISYDDEGHTQDVETNEYYQFTRSGAEDFRKYARHEFCTCLTEYISRAGQVPTKDNPNVVTETEKDLLIKFFIDHDIPAEHLDNIYSHLSDFRTDKK